MIRFLSPGGTDRGLCTPNAVCGEEGRDDDVPTSRLSHDRLLPSPPNFLPNLSYRSPPPLLVPTERINSDVALSRDFAARVTGIRGGGGCAHARRKPAFGRRMRAAQMFSRARGGGRKGRQAGRWGRTEGEMMGETQTMLSQSRKVGLLPSFPAPNSHLRAEVSLRPRTQLRTP